MKITNKNKNGVTIKTNNGFKQSMSWSEFEQNFIMDDDKMHCRFKPEFLEIGDKINKHVVDAAVNYLLSNGPNTAEKLANIASFGEHIEEICKLANCSILEATDLVKQFVNSSLSNNTKKHYDRSTDRKRVKKNDNKPSVISVTSEHKATFADLPGMDKLKAMIND